MEVKCSLVTGQERIMLDNSTHYSCTVEMCNTTQKFNVAVLDEIQLIGDQNRGSAWTTALLGLQAEEIHLCGDERALKLVHDICLLTGDTLIKKNYTRLGDLVMENMIVSSVSDLRPGDCLISFSKKTIFTLKEQINSKLRLMKSKEEKEEQEEESYNRCAVVYGNLPPEIKKFQATSFNERKNGIQYLIATDAVSS